MNTQPRTTDDMMVRPEGRYHHLKCISWSAIFTGALIGIGISFIFNLFAAAIGLTAFVNTTAGVNSIAIGGVIGLAIITLFSMGIAGWVAGYLGRPHSLHRDLGVIYGFTTWSVALLLMVLLSGHIGRFITYNLATLEHPGYAINNMGQNHPMMANQNANMNVNNSNPDSAMATNDHVVVSSQDAAKALATSTCLAFALFFIGALAASIGGHCGARSCEKDLARYPREDRLM